MAVSNATLELLGWISSGNRSYLDAMEAWTSKCPFHATWDDAVADGLIQVSNVGDTSGGSTVRLSPKGRAALVASR